LFATLDPTMRGLKLPSGRRVILSDTVGFISDLPVELVAAFRATLEEVLEADVIAHIRDAAHEESDAQKADVLEVLVELGVDEDHTRIVEVLNKIDLLEPEARNTLLEHNGEAGAIAVSALTGEGVPKLLHRLDQMLGKEQNVLKLTLDAADGAGLAWAYRHGRILNRRDNAKGVALTVAVDPQDMDRFRNRFADNVIRTHH
jgi:GTP-binding protein HflX